MTQNTGKNKQASSDFQELQTIGEAENSRLEPYYDVIETGTRAGVWFYDVGTTKDGNLYMKPPVRLSDPFKVVGRGQGLKEDEQRVLEYRRNGYGKKHLVAFPLELLGMRDGWALLRSLGIGIAQNATKQAALADYIQWHGSTKEWQIATRGGWCNDQFTAYALPNGEIIGKGELDVIYAGDTSKKIAYVTNGSLQEWQDNIVRYLAGNSRPLLAMGAVFASPLLGMFGHESGGFHFFGSSSMGKSISGFVASSVIGLPENIKVDWKGTQLGFDNEAAANNDGFVFLDEIGEADGKTVKEVGYSIFSGTSKLQGAAKGGNRARQTWRVLVISTGEFSVAHYLKKEGLEWQAGQAARLPSIPADTHSGYFAFDNIHDFKTSLAFSDYLKSACQSYCGSAWRPYLQGLIDLATKDRAALLNRVTTLQTQFLARLPELSNQSSRVAKRFAFAAAGLELAAELGITGLPAGVGSDGVYECFMAWYGLDGKVNYEEKQIIEAAKTLLQRDGNGERFVLLHDNTSEIRTERNHAGFRYPPNNALSYKPVFYLTDEVFLKEICQGKDPNYVCKVLRDAGWLSCEKESSKQRNKRRLRHRLCNLDSRFYCLIGDRPPSEYEELDSNGA